MIGSRAEIHFEKYLRGGGLKCIDTFFPHYHPNHPNLARYIPDRIIRIIRTNLHLGLKKVPGGTHLVTPSDIKDTLIS